MPDSHALRLERAHRALLGLAVGDGFGERFFGPPLELLPMFDTRQLPPAPWCWTDDTAMAVSVVDVLERHGGIVVDALALAFARRYAAEPHRGYGSTAHEILQAIGEGQPWPRVASAPYGGTGSMGNGSAMRVAPVGAYFADDLNELVEHATRSAKPTHTHPEAAAGAVAIALGTALHLQRCDAASIFRAVLEHTPGSRTREGIEAAAALDLDTPVGDAAKKLGNGSSVVCHDTVPFCLWMSVRHCEDFEEAMWQTVSGLGDRDTTCAIVGGMLANRCEPPPHFVDALEPFP